MVITKFKLSNLNCEACVKVSKLKIGQIDGVESVLIKGAGSEANGQLESTREISLSEIKQALVDLPYGVASI
ncbi:MAG TPA: hypothetical protein VJH75_02795 [Patescibacteria group bacterium]|nr:hypothetical protein [Patescibacteria group bacterium]